jgi:2-C-methyl-D-erythritol 2,4-cyclodiphosphate synthase
MYVGFGYDVHRLVEGRALVLGGVTIPHTHGLLGHSDADVLLHALMDALLGAAGLPDIGFHFPDTNERFRGANSLRLLAEVREILAREGFRPGNVDVTLVAERPKIAPYVPAMRENIAGALGLDPRRVGIKATTNEGMGFVGQKEGMCAYAVATVVPL